MADVIFKNRKPNAGRLADFGFEKTDGDYTYRTDLANGQLKLTVTVTANGQVTTAVTDSNTDDDYVLHRVADAVGPFVGQVKAEYETVLGEIDAACFDPEVFKSKQAKEIIAYMKNTYGDEPEYLWKKFPDNAVVRRKDTQTWYAALLTVSRRKLGMASDETVEILDLRLRPEDIEHTVDHIRYFPGYHMNKKHWITVCLDSTLSAEEIYRRLDDSYRLAKK